MTEHVVVSEKAVQELLASLHDVALENGLGRGKEGMLALLGFAAGQLATELEVESGSNSRETVEHVLNAIRAGIFSSRTSLGRATPFRPDEKIH